MNLASPQYVAYLAIVYLIWRYAVPTDAARKTFLLAASYLFYATWDLRFIVVLAATTLVQWCIGARIAAENSAQRRRLWLGLSIVFALGLLGYFKYANFFVSEIAALLESAGLASVGPLTRIVAPIGISFYTFQCLTYTIDIYRGVERPVASLRDFALFVAFFGHVTAGPISRARLLIPQIERPATGAVRLDSQAVFLIARGLVKKIVFADVLAVQFVAPAFTAPDQWSPAFLIVAVIAYSFQIYMDVSGYTDIARGSGRCFGYELAFNFDRPYFATSVSNFWQRWHISVSSFFRDYLYFGLGGSRRGNVYVNLLLTFIAIGLWHGAGWNFVLYGALHGSMVSLERWRRTHRGVDQSPPRIGAFPDARAIVTTFLFVAFSRILFVAADVTGAASYVRALFLSTSHAGAAGLRGYVTLLLAIALHMLPRPREAAAARWFFARPVIVQGVALLALVVMLVGLATEQRPFVYFRF